MGRTLATFTGLVQEEEARWTRFRRALRREDQEALDQLWAWARAHAAEGAYASMAAPFPVMLLSMLLELAKKNRELERRVAELCPSK